MKDFERKDSSALIALLFSAAVMPMGFVVSANAIYNRYGIGEGTSAIYLSIFFSLSAVFLLILPIMIKRLKQKKSLLWFLSFLSYVCSHVFVEIGVFKTGGFYSRYLPDSSFVLSLTPSLFGLALLSRELRTGSKVKHKLVLLLSYVLVFLIFSASIFIVLDYVWMDFIINNVNIYAALAFTYSTLIIIGYVFCTFGKKKIYPIVFISLAIVVSFFMNVLSFEKGSLVISIANGNFGAWWTRLHPIYYLKGFLFASVGSYSILYLVASLIAMNANVELED